MAPVLLVAFPLLKLALHLAVGRGYGYHGDELYYLACTDHLDWGYVDHPPVSILVLAVTRALVGDSVTAIRIVPALAGALTVFLIGLMTRRLGGGVFAMAVSMLGAIAAPFYLSLGGYFSMNSLDILVWATVAWLVMRMLDGSEPGTATVPMRHWIILGVLLGIGIENKFSVVWLSGGLFAGLLLTPYRALLATRGPWIAAGIAFAFVVPQIIWQAAHGFPTAYFMAGAADNFRHITPSMYLGMQIEGMLPVVAPIWIAGLIFFLVLPQGRRVRVLGWTWLLVFAVLAFSRSSRGYYPAPSYTWLLAGGGVAIEAWLRRPWVYVAGPVYLVLIALSGLQALPVVLPIWPQERLAAYSKATGAGLVAEGRPVASPIPDFLAHMSEWDEIVSQIADVYDQVPAAERARTMVLMAYYSPAAAVDILGRARGLPLASSGSFTYWFWGPHGAWDGPVIALGYSEALLRESFAQVESVGETRCTYCSERPLAIWMARGLRIPADTFWDRVRRR